jgi:hypothetical protein
VNAAGVDAALPAEDLQKVAELWDTGFAG